MNYKISICDDQWKLGVQIFCKNPPGVCDDPRKKVLLDISHERTSSDHVKVLHCQYSLVGDYSQPFLFNVIG